MAKNSEMVIKIGIFLPVSNDNCLLKKTSGQVAS